MRNLRNLKHAAISFGQDGAGALPTATAWGGTGLICAFGPSESDPAITLKRLPNDAYSPDQAYNITSWDAPSPNPDLAVDRILNIHCLQESGMICLVLEGGDIIIVREDAQDGEDQIEIVGSVDAGIAAASWSPDEELLSIATKADTLLFMTRDFEGIANITFSSDDLKVSNHVSVGWGKRETQFQGRGAKALRDPTVPEHVDEGKLSTFEDGRTTISWRGDGQYVAVNSILDNARRVIRVYSREGELDSVSEPVDGLEGALSWKPSGQLLAGIQRKEDKIEVVFFERNGLQHGEFSLRLSKDEIDTIGGSVALDWNNDSSVLAVSLKDRVQLWIMGNYHYYLKQEIQLDTALHGAVNTTWHSEKPLRLACFADLSLRMLDYTFEVARGSVVPPYDLGIVAVIDGRKLKVTPLRTANVPPPMALDEIDLVSEAIDVAINKTGTKIAVLHNNQVTLWSCDYASKPVKRAGTTLTSSTELNMERVVHRQIAFGEEDDITVVSASVNASGARLTRLSGSRGRSVDDVETTTLLCPCTDHDRTIAQDASGAVTDLSVAPGRSVGKLPTVCTSVEVWTHEGVDIVFGLTAGGMLHVQSEAHALKIPGCTSFVATASHLVYTTSQHLLKFIHLHGGQLEVPPDEPEKDERCRNIERGAKLITVMPSAYSLVLQMPRGNLETIYPRALVLAGIRHAIGNRDYKRAFSICRTQRVDMNILHDYTPQQFMNDIPLFIKQVKKIEYIDLFLSSLSDEDVTQTIYKETMPVADDDSGIAMNGATNGDAPVLALSNPPKMNKICDAFLEVLSGHESTYLQCIVTAHVSKNPPDLEAGLSLVAQLRKQGKQEQPEQAVEHICFLADVNQLYNTALGIYDLDVTLLVAQQSQKDPREYLPYLQQLQDMEPLRQRHAIDNDLKRYSKALKHLHELNEFEEVKAYAAKHDLYSAAIELYRYDNTRLTELMRLYGNYLDARNRYKEAGIAFEYIQDYGLAYEAYRACSMWRECLACAGLTDMSDEKMSGLASDLAESLEEAKDYVSAATIYLDHLHDLDTAVRLLCRGYQFADAIRHISLQRRPELLKDLVDPGLIEASAIMTEMLAEMKTQLQNQVPRLRELRQKKAENPMAFLDGGGDDDNMPDDISLAPTNTTTAGTFMTRYTNRSMGTLATDVTRKTSKNRRREERKRARGKKGTVYEEEYLVNSIARLIERLNATGDDTSRLVEGLMRRTMRERALAVDKAFQDVVESCGACMDEVFMTHAAQPAHTGTQESAEEPHRPWGGQGVLFDALSASHQKKEAPLLKAFERLSLLEKS
ncbi:Elongator complex protein 1 [Fulvia fulva]|uniref:Elongator complex protein 1 n=1 Tax=Passalora fulva TaxID=5499 RepID=A0A9Q8PLV7_PASFU|nr:Elongator complex protein 1 [Fulvia fulva]KAK4610495.1 Elongator complex protein 1 [Fulvia fulva]KAK4610820.1 Elongator complex protein 1 [Fulvia fulva]UJO24815.1 Elongator complex protein 1 [Fulvia fulva]WPV21959.1 Elongator complex protein 1 [Fulvia fulva]WPV37149.1 Elongator complex protein 1 [Fulvia fulva]